MKTFRGVSSFLRVLLAALLVACLSPLHATEALQAGGLRAKYEAVTPQLRSSQFHGPLVLESVEDARNTRGDVYAVIEHPFERVSHALADPGHWCDILILHLNVKYCRGSGGAAPQLDVRIGRKFDQPLGSASQVVFAWRAAAVTPDYVDVELDAPEGPFGTKAYRIVVEAIGVDAAHTFLHMGYSFSYGALGQMAMSSYLATIGRDKVGFTSVAGTAPGEPPRFIGGTRGLTERNTMRYYLAIDAYLDALAAPPGEQLERRLQGWFAATEQYAQQLHELDRGTYLAMKRSEVRRQQGGPG